jgi:hypothetical protein
VHLCKICSPIKTTTINSNQFINKLTSISSEYVERYKCVNSEYINATVKLKFECEQHGDFWILPHNAYKLRGCPKCTHRVSSPEFEILEMFDNAVHSDRSLIYPKELDICCYDNKIAVEFNGIMWHSSGRSSSSKFNVKCNDIRNKHVDKTNLVEDKDFQLFHIFEPEWTHKKDIWKSIINKTMNKTIKLPDFFIKEINNNIINEFLKNNHLISDVRCTITLGLYVDDELISIIGINDEDDGNYKILHFVDKVNVNFDKTLHHLIEYFESKYKPLTLSYYVDRRWSSGLCETLGFKFIKNIEPKSFYFKVNENILFQTDINAEIMISKGYRRIFDSGDKLFVKYY